MLTWQDRVSVDTSIWTGIKLGFGIAIGATFVVVLGWLAVILFLGYGLSGRGI